MDVYKIAIGLSLTGNIDREVKGLLREMQTLERRVDAIGKSLKNWITPLQAISSQISATNKGVKQVADSFGKWGTPLRAVGTQIGQIEKSIAGLSRAGGGLNNWGQAFETRMAAVTRTVETQAQKMQAAINRVHGAAPRMTGPGPMGGVGGAGYGRGPGPLRRDLAPLRRGMVPAGQYGMGFGAYGGASGIGTLYEEGANFVVEGLKQKNAGLTPEQAKLIDSDALRLSRKYPSQSELDIKRQHRLLQSNVGNDFEKSRRVLEPYIRGAVALKTLRGPEQAEKDMEHFARFIDVIGRSTSEKDTMTLIDGFIKALQADEEAVKAMDFNSAAKAGGGAGKGVGTNFWTSTFPQIAAQQGGPRAGTDLASFMQNTVGNRASVKATFAQYDEGLREGVKFDYNRKGERVMIKKGGMVDELLLRNDPTAWTLKHVIPKMVAKGMLPAGFDKGDYTGELTDEMRASGQGWTSSMFSNRRGENYASVTSQEIAQIIKGQQAYARNRGATDVEKDQEKDPFIQWNAFKSQLKNLMADIAGPNMGSVVAGLKSMRESIQGLSDWAKNPENAGAVKKVFDGLSAAATGLTVAALAGVITAIGPGGLVIGGIAAMIKLDWDGFQKRLKATTDELERIRAGFEGLGAFFEPWAAKLGLTNEATKKFIADDPLTAFATYLADAHKGRLEELKNIFVAGANLLGLEIQAWPGRWSVWILELGKKLDELIKKIFKGPMDWLNKGHEEHSSLIGGSSMGTLHGNAGNDNLSGLGGFGGGGSVRALAVGEGTGIGHVASKAERAANIRAYAQSIGMDPETALRVAQSEGFNEYIGDKKIGGAFGDFQLLAHGGLGAIALRQGINIRDPNTWREQHKFALDYAKKHGWGSWYGARKVGIGKWQGINALGGVAGSRVGAGKGKLSGLDTDFAERVAALQAEYPNLGITSGFRSHAEQAALYRSKPGLAARPGHSKHEHGLAADLNWGGKSLWDGLGPEGHARLRESAAKHGLYFPMMTRQRGRKWEPWHIERMPGAGPRTPTVGAPPKQEGKSEVLNVNVDGKTIAKVAFKHGAKMARKPNSAGGPDTYGHQHGPGTPLRDWA